MKKLTIWLLGIACLPLSLAHAEPLIPALPFLEGTMQVSGMGMLMSSSTKQGSQGPEGTTILTHSEFVFNRGWWAWGFYYQYDKHGKNQEDVGYGPKVELVWSPFYLELGYTYYVDRGYKDRVIAAETGSGSILGGGVRFLLGGIGASGVFFQASYKYRTQKLVRQDGVRISESIEQKDGYPVFGLGYQF